jgi:DNA-binding transcriptional MerR regulator
MTPRASIGEFSRAAHLSVKTLRHYHEVGLLEPSEIDPNSGYRYYSYEQIPTAQVIRRLRGGTTTVNRSAVHRQNRIN